MAEAKGMSVEVKRGSAGGESRFGWFAAVRVGAAALLLLALGDWPYGYYQLLRVVVCGVGIYGFYTAYRGGRQQVWLWLFGTIAVLWNPVFPIYLERAVWSVLDVVGAAALGVSVWLFSGKHAGSDTGSRQT